MSNVKISDLPEFTGNTSGSWLVMDDSTQTNTYKVLRENIVSTTSGTSGTSGYNGINGTSGSSGTSGSNGTSGINGTNGSSGTSGSGGTSGIGLGISTKAGSVDATGWSYDGDNNQYTKLITFSSPFGSTNYTINSVYSKDDPNSFTVVRTGFSGKTVNGFTAIVGTSSGSIAPTFEYTATAFQETGVPGTSGTSGTSGSGTSGTSGFSLFAQTGSVWNTTNNVGITGSLNVSSSLSALGDENKIYGYNNYISGRTANLMAAGSVNTLAALVNYITSSAYTTILSPTVLITGSLVASGSIHRLIGNTEITGSIVSTGSISINGKTNVENGVAISNTIQALKGGNLLIATGSASGSLGVGGNVILGQFNVISGSLFTRIDGNAEITGSLNVLTTGINRLSSSNSNQLFADYAVYGNIISAYDGTNTIRAFVNTISAIGTGSYNNIYGPTQLTGALYITTPTDSLPDNGLYVTSAYTGVGKDASGTYTGRLGFYNSENAWIGTSGVYSNFTVSSLKFGSGSVKYLTINSNANGNTITGSLTVTGSLNVTGGITGSLQGTSSYATQALSASYAPAASTFPYTGSAIITGSLNITGSVLGNVNSLSIASTTASLNLSDGNFFTLQLVSGSSTHLNPSNIKPGQTVSVFVNTIGSATMTFPSSVKQISGSSYVPTTSTGIDILTLISKDSSSLYLVNAQNFI